MFAGRFGALAASRRNKASDRRKEASRYKKEQRQKCTTKLDGIMERFDTNKSGKLEKDQVKALLTEFDYTTPPGTQPSDEEVEFVMRMADARMDEAIDRKELIDALAAWNSYLKQKELIDGVMEKYDTNNSGALDKEQVRNMLTELNDNMPVSEEEVTKVMEHCDISGSQDLKKAEVLLAVNYWYSEADDEEKAPDKEKEKEKSGCCVVQ